MNNGDFMELSPLPRAPHVFCCNTTPLLLDGILQHKTSNELHETKGFREKGNLCRPFHERAQKKARSHNVEWSKKEENQ